MKKRAKNIGIYSVLFAWFFLSNAALDNQFSKKNENDDVFFQKFLLTYDADGAQSIELDCSLLKEFFAHYVLPFQNSDQNIFSEDVILFGQKITQGQKKFVLEEFIRNIVELLSLCESLPEEDLRSRPLAVYGLAQNVIPSPLFVANNEKILGLLQELLIIIQQCCILINTDFEGTFTVLETFEQEIQSTFTIINEIKNTIAVEFDGTFTTLDACCQALLTDFSGVFTTLSTITGTVTQGFNDTFTSLNACCQQGAQDFNGIFTILAETSAIIATDFEIIFTTLSGFQADFNSIFTIINDINKTINSDFSGIFTSLNECCQSVEVEFNGVFTVLAGLHQTLEQDFNDTWTKLNSISQGLLETLTVIGISEVIFIQDAYGTFSILNACTESANADFMGIFTTISFFENEVVMDFNGVFTAISACCSTDLKDFSGIFTVLQELTTTLTIDFNGTFTAINSFQDDLAASFTSFDVLKGTVVAGFNGTFTAINACCSMQSTDFSAIFTVIDDIFVTLATDANGTFTVINACCSALSSDLMGIFTALSSLDVLIKQDFNGTFTALESLNTLCNNAQQLPEPTQGILITITAPGYYCLTDDVPFEIIITTSNVTFDLNNHTLSGIAGVEVLNASNVQVINGRIESDVGISLGNSVDVTLRNLFINSTIEGIEITTCTSIFIEDVAITGTQSIFGVSIFGADNLHCKRIDLLNFSGQIGIGTTFEIIPGIAGLTNSSFEDCQIVNANPSSVFFFGFSMVGSNNRCVRCNIKNVSLNLQTDPSNEFTGFFVGSNNTVLEDCNVDTINSSQNVPSNGFSLFGSNVVLKNCLANNFNTSTLGFNFLGGKNLTLFNCITQNMSAVAATGFVLNGSSNATLINCQSRFLINGTGFSALSNNAFILLNCVAQTCAIGYEITSNVILGNCIANLCLDAGFFSSGLATAYGCFSYTSAANYTNIPNVQAASQTTNVFARGNNFI